jgi:phage tail protein X
VNKTAKTIADAIGLPLALESYGPTRSTVSFRRHLAPAVRLQKRAPTSTMLKLPDPAVLRSRTQQVSIHPLCG